jgi:hypothetical protein
MCPRVAADCLRCRYDDLPGDAPMRHVLVRRCSYRSIVAPPDARRAYGRRYLVTSRTCAGPVRHEGSMIRTRPS